MTDLIRKSTSSLLQLSAGLVQCTGWLALICFPKAEMDLEKRLDKLLAGFEIACCLQFCDIFALSKYYFICIDLSKAGK